MIYEERYYVADQFYMFTCHNHRKLYFFHETHSFLIESNHKTFAVFLMRFTGDMYIYICISIYIYLSISISISIYIYLYIYIYNIYICIYNGYILYIYCLYIHVINRYIYISYNTYNYILYIYVCVCIYIITLLFQSPRLLKMAQTSHYHAYSRHHVY